MLQSKCEVFYFFQEIIQGPYGWSFESSPLSPIFLYNYGVKIWAMCVQLKEVHNKKTPKKERNLMFECYNLLDPMEWGAAIFWQQGNYKILWLLP